MNARVSVVIPVYNGEKFIARAVDSVLAQTHAADEIIVINDGSTDKTLDRLSGYEGRLRLISIPNGGVANARNVGIRACTGDFVAFLDADDVWLPQKLELQIKAMREYPTVGLCCSDFIRNGELEPDSHHFSRFVNTKPINFDTPLRTNPFILLLKQNFVGTSSTVVVKKSVLDEVGVFNAKYRQAEDYDLWLRCALVTDFLVTSGALVRKEFHGSNLTKDYLEMCVCHERVLFDIRDTYRPYLNRNKLWRVSSVALARHRYELGNAYFKTGSIKSAYMQYVQGLRVCPTPQNLLDFLIVASKKAVRILQAGFVNRESFNKRKSFLNVI